MKQFNNKTIGNGFTILEVLIATFVITVGLIATLLLINRTLIQASIFLPKLTAAYLAQEGIEIVRNIRDTNWVGGGVWNEGLVPSAVDCSTGCEADYTFIPSVSVLTPYNEGRYLNTDISGPYGYNPGGTATKFKRKITIETISSSTLRIIIRVEFEEREKIFSYTAQENLYKWR